MKIELWPEPEEVARRFDRIMADWDTGKFDPRDLRAGDHVVRLKRPPSPAKSGALYVEVWNGKPKGEAYRNYIEAGNLPPHVLAAVEEGDSYWHIRVQNGQIKFLSEAEQGDWNMDVFESEPPYEVKIDELAEKLIEKCELELVKPDLYRFNGVNDEQWEEIKTLATEMINGRA